MNVVSLTPPKAYKEELEAAGIDVFSLDIRQKLPDPRPFLRLIQIIRNWKPEIVHSHMVHANILARLANPLTSKSLLICTAHNTDEGGRFRELAYRLTDPLSDLTTQVSQAGIERYIRIGAVPQSKIRYIPNGVDIELFHPNMEARSRVRRELNLQKTFIWLAVGRFCIQKDYSNMIQAFSLVAQKQKEARLLIVGDGPMRPEIEKLARNQDIKDQIIFLGTGCDICELMKSSDAYVMSSAWEGMPMVLLEASATGLPIVATNVGGIADLVEDGETGFLVPPKNPDALSEAMIHLMDCSKEERRRMGELGRQNIEASYSIEHVVDMWEELFRELLLLSGSKVVGD